MLSAQELVLDLKLRAKSDKVAAYAFEAEFWSELQFFTPFFEDINSDVTLLEGDGSPLSHLPLAFVVIAEALMTLDLPANVWRLKIILFPYPTKQ